MRDAFATDHADPPARGVGHDTCMDGCHTQRGGLEGEREAKGESGYAVLLTDTTLKAPRLFVFQCAEVEKKRLRPIRRKDLPAVESLKTSVRSSLFVQKGWTTDRTLSYYNIGIMEIE